MNIITTDATKFREVSNSVIDNHIMHVMMTVNTPLINIKDNAQYTNSAKTVLYKIQEISNGVIYYHLDDSSVIRLLFIPDTKAQYSYFILCEQEIIEKIKEEMSTEFYVSWVTISHQVNGKKINDKIL